MGHKELAFWGMCHAKCMAIIEWWYESPCDYTCEACNSTVHQGPSRATKKMDCNHLVVSPQKLLRCLGRKGIVPAQSLPWVPLLGVAGWYLHHQREATVSLWLPGPEENISYVWEYSMPPNSHRPQGLPILIQVETSIDPWLFEVLARYTLFLGRWCNILQHVDPFYH